MGHRGRDKRWVRGIPQVGAAVIAVFDDNNCGSVGVRPSNLDRIFDCLGTGVEKCRALGMVTRGQSIKSLTNLYITGVRGHHEAGVGKCRHLALNICDHIWIGISYRGHRDPRSHVDHGVTVNVNQHTAAGLGNENRQSYPDSR